MKKSIIGAILVLSGFILSGCLGTSPQSSFYILSAGRDNVPVSQVKTSVGVYPVQVPVFLDRPQIVLNETATELSFSEINRWSEPLPQITQRALVENLQQFLPNAYVETKGYDERIFQHLVKVNVLSMTGEQGKEARLSAWWIITNADGKELWRERFDKTLSCGKTYASYVQAQNQLWALLAHQIALKIK